MDAALELSINFGGKVLIIMPKQRHHVSAGSTKGLPDISPV